MALLKVRQGRAQSAGGRAWWTGRCFLGSSHCRGPLQRFAGPACGSRQWREGGPVVKRRHTATNVAIFHDLVLLFKCSLSCPS